MPISQFKIYTSEDIQGPGPIRGVAGDLVRVLDAVLVQGYGTGSYYKPSPGWTKPAPNSGSVYGAYQMPSGSRYCLFINDNGPNVRGVLEAYAGGWMYVTSSCTSPGATPPLSMIGASGSYGQFPNPAQAATDGTNFPGCVSVRKSNTASTTPRSWLIAADAYGMYMWIWTGDYADRCHHWAFGDFSSIKGDADLANCLIYGGFQYDTYANCTTDLIAMGVPRSTGYYSWHGLNFRQYGHWLAASVSGTGGSMPFTTMGDVGAGSTGYGNGTSWVYYGRKDGSFAADPSTGAYYMSPLYIVEITAQMVRGKFRGLYYPIHPYNTFSNGQIIQGSGDYAGKTFMMICWGMPSYGVWALEISNTVETDN